MYCRPQGYPSPHPIVPIRYHSTVPGGKTLCQFQKRHRRAQRGRWRGYVGSVQHHSAMIFITYPDHGCVYTLSQEDGDELYYAPIYADGNINLEEFAPVDLDSADMDEMELFDIRNRLSAMCQV